MLLEFEKPIAELEEKLADMKMLASNNDVDVVDAVHVLEKEIKK
jgi:acetyl-CoA carboxylase carboxyl transferase subunit alpha